MKNNKTELIQIRLIELEKTIIKQKADLLGMTITDYIRECCIFSNTTEMFIDKLHKTIDY